MIRRCVTFRSPFWLSASPLLSNSPPSFQFSPQSPSSSLICPLSSVRFGHGKGIPKKPDPFSYQENIKQVDWSVPPTPEELKQLPDIRKMTNDQWRLAKRDEDQQISACFHGIYPDILPSPLLPTINMLVEFPEDTLVFRGNWIQPFLLLEKPKVSFQPIGTESLDMWETHWTLLMVDADEPSREQPDARARQHWVVANIPARGKIEDGTCLVDYMPPTPWKNSGPHRYTFLLFQQPNGLISFDDFTPIPSSDWSSKRDKLSISDFSSKYGLQLQSYVFFQSEWDDSVSQRLAKLGIDEPEWETDEETVQRYQKKMQKNLRLERELEKKIGMKPSY